ncbi:MAG: DUF6325 family protein [Candidatus Nanopelagicales bacterium]
MTEVDFDDVELGPIDYLVLEYPNGQPTGEALPYLVDLVERGIVRILDVAIVAKTADGDVSAIDMEQLAEVGGGELGLFDGAATGLLDDEDIAQTGEILSPGAIGAILVYENTWAAPFATAVRKAGGQLIANGRIPVNAIIAALEAVEGENV